MVVGDATELGTYMDTYQKNVGSTEEKIKYSPAVQKQSSLLGSISTFLSSVDLTTSY